MSGDIIMTEELCRAKFEDHCASWGISFHVRSPDMKGYWNHETDMLWRFWQAAWNTRAEMEKSDGQ